MRPLAALAAAAAAAIAWPPALGAPANIVAVFDIETSGVALGKPALERLNIYLATKIAAAGYQVVPRAELLKRLRDQKRASYKECYDQSCQIEIGRELAAQKSLSTKVLGLGKECVVTIALFDLKRSASERAADSSGPCDIGGLVRSIENAVQKLAVGAAPAAVMAPAGVADAKLCPRPGTLRVGEPPPNGTYYFCVDKRGQREGPSVHWHNNGKLLMTSEYRANKQVGKAVEYHRNGKKRREVLYVDGKKQGRVVEWDERGNRFEEGQYKDDKKEGVWTRWINGKLYQTETFKNDDRNGPHVVWDTDSGKKRYEGSYRDGQRDGIWTYYRDGKVVQQGPYRDDMREGVWSEYHPQTGVRTAVGTYRRDRREGMWTEFDHRTGERGAQGSYRDNKRHGTWTTWRGDIVITMTYREGKLDGPYVVVRDGQEVSRRVYQDGRDVTPR